LIKELKILANAILFLEKNWQSLFVLTHQSQLSPTTRKQRMGCGYQKKKGSPGHTDLLHHFLSACAAHNELAVSQRPDCMGELHPFASAPAVVQG
jgi:hypothetical protein